MEDNIGLKGHVKIDHNGLNVVDTYNTVVTLGKEAFARGVVSGGYAAVNPAGWMAIGTGSDTIVVGDTTLATEYFREGPETGATGSVTGSTTTTTETNDTARWIGSFGIDATKTVNEAGIFNLSGLDLGSMTARTAFADIAAISGDQINITWDIAVA